MNNYDPAILFGNLTLRELFYHVSSRPGKDGNAIGLDTPLRDYVGDIFIDRFEEITNVVDSKYHVIQDFIIAKNYLESHEDMQVKIVFSLPVSIFHFDRYSDATEFLNFVRPRGLYPAVDITNTQNGTPVAILAREFTFSSASVIKFIEKISKASFPSDAHKPFFLIEK